MMRSIFVLAGLAFAGSAFAGVEADPSKSYTITPEAGPWLIRAAIFVGPESPQLAHQLVLEVRSRFNLPAYVFNHGEEERHKQQEYLQQLHQKYDQPNVPKAPLRCVRIEDQCAVLVGGYKDIEIARRALETIKKLAPPSSDKLMPLLSQIELDAGPNGQPKAVITEKPVNPFLSSFVVHNPTVPMPPPESKPDTLLRKLNSHESYSVLNCRKPWTLAVATYQGAQVIQTGGGEPSFWEKLWGNGTGDMLEASGHNAHNFAQAMRKAGWEAYVLHTRWGAVVTVGGFDSANDLQIEEVKRTLASSFQIGRGPQMLAQPLPMEVPRP